MQAERAGGDKQQRERRSRCGHRLVTIKLLDAPWRSSFPEQHEVLCVHPLVKGAMMAEGSLECSRPRAWLARAQPPERDVIPWRDGAGYDGSLGPSPQTSFFPIRSFTVKPVLPNFHPQVTQTLRFQ